MVLILVDFLLIINFIISWKHFRDIIAPPVIHVLGLLLASLISSIYMTEWGMDEMFLTTGIILGICPLVFTICCLLLSKQENENVIETNQYDRLDLRKFFIPILLIGFLNILVCVLKLIIIRQSFSSSLNFSELLFAVRISTMKEDESLQYPQMIIWASNLCNFFFYITSWLLAYCFLTKERINKILIIPIIIHFASIAFEGALTGAKGSSIQPIACAIFTIMLLRRNSGIVFNMNLKIITRGVLLVSVLAILFKGYSELLGRNTSNHESSGDMFAEYMGAEIKNLDIFVSSNKNYNIKEFGGTTFRYLYKDISHNFKIPDIYTFNEWKNHSLGNVYTEYYPYYIDFGLLGCIIMSVILATISMFFYNRSKQSFNRINLFELLYPLISYGLFMSFFDNFLANYIFRIGFVKLVIYLYIITWCSNKFLLRKLNN